MPTNIAAAAAVRIGVLVTGIAVLALGLARRGLGLGLGSGSGSGKRDHRPVARFTQRGQAFVDRFVTRLAHRLPPSNTSRSPNCMTRALRGLARTRLAFLVQQPVGIVFQLRPGQCHALIDNGGTARAHLVK